MAQNTLNPYFVSGLTEGEGSFSYWKSGGRVYPQFAIKLNIKDRPLIEKVQNFFEGIGSLYGAKARTYTLNDVVYTSGELSIFRVCQIGELMKLVWHFLDYPLEGKKAEAFKVWKEMVMIKAVNRKEDWPKLHDLAVELTKANGAKIKRPRKKNKVEKVIVGRV